MPDNEDRSLLSTHLWDVRASLESQIRCLTTLQQILTAFRKTADVDVRAALRARMMRDFTELEGLSFAVLRVLKPAIEEAKRELSAA
jgi:hypothetical protein